MKTICPSCKAVHPHVAEANGKSVPEDGDFSICVDCGALARFDASAPGGLAPLTPEDRKAVIAEVPEIAAVYAHGVRRSLAESLARNGPPA